MSPTTSSRSSSAHSLSTATDGRIDLERAYATCVAKTRRNIAQLADQPKSGAFAEDGNYFEFKEGFFDIGNWTSSFFTGMALLAFETSQDFFFLKQTNRLADVYAEKVTRRGMDTMHDLGFLYSLYSVALYKLTGDLNHRRTAVTAADELAKRFVVKGGYLRAWGRMDETATHYAGLAIIDCLMNLPLLFWASQETGNRFYHDIAVRHADTTLTSFVRSDDSVYHSFRFDHETGAPARGDNYCGRAVESHWARGTAWAIYGFALAYGYTRDVRYLATSERLAQKFVALLDEEVVPVWDFRLEAGEKKLRDASAAAIAVCGLYELTKQGTAKDDLTDAADRLLGKLCDRAYLDTDERCPGVLRNAQMGDGVGRARNVYTSWGDSFLTEALAKKIYGVGGFW